MYLIQYSLKNENAKEGLNFFCFEFSFREDWRYTFAILKKEKHNLLEIKYRYLPFLG